MVDKVETTAKAVETAGLEKSATNPTLNLVDIKAEPNAKPLDVPQTRGTTETPKGFPTLTLDDSDSARKAENRKSFDVKEKPRFEGTGNWAPLENYTLATPKDDGMPKAKDQPGRQGQGTPTASEKADDHTAASSDNRHGQGQRQGKPVKH